MLVTPSRRDPWLGGPSHHVGRPIAPPATHVAVATEEEHEEEHEEQQEDPMLAALENVVVTAGGAPGYPGRWGPRQAEAPVGTLDDALDDALDDPGTLALAAAAAAAAAADRRKKSHGHPRSARSARSNSDTCSWSTTSNYLNNGKSDSKSNTNLDFYYNNWQQRQQQQQRRRAVSSPRVRSLSTSYNYYYASSTSSSCESEASSSSLSCSSCPCSSPSHSPSASPSPFPSPYSSYSAAALSRRRSVRSMKKLLPLALLPNPPPQHQQQARPRGEMASSFAAVHQPSPGTEQQDGQQTQQHMQHMQHVQGPEGCNLPEALARDLDLSSLVFAAKNMTAGPPSRDLAYYHDEKNKKRFSGAQNRPSKSRRQQPQPLPPTNSNCDDPTNENGVDATKSRRRDGGDPTNRSPSADPSQAQRKQSQSQGQQHNFQPPPIVRFEAAQPTDDEKKSRSNKGKAPAQYGGENEIDDVAVAPDFDADIINADTNPEQDADADADAYSLSNASSGANSFSEVEPASVRQHSVGTAATSITGLPNSLLLAGSHKRRHSIGHDTNASWIDLDPDELDDSDMEGGDVQSDYGGDRDGVDSQDRGSIEEVSVPRGPQSQQERRNKGKQKHRHRGAADGKRWIPPMPMPQSQPVRPLYGPFDDGEPPRASSANAALRRQSNPFDGVSMAVDRAWSLQMSPSLSSAPEARRRSVHGHMEISVPQRHSSLRNQLFHTTPDPRGSWGLDKCEDYEGKNKETLKMASRQKDEEQRNSALDSSTLILPATRYEPNIEGRNDAHTKQVGEERQEREAQNAHHPSNNINSYGYGEEEDDEFAIDDDLKDEIAPWFRYVDGDLDLQVPKKRKSPHQINHPAGDDAALTNMQHHTHQPQNQSSIPSLIPASPTDVKIQTWLENSLVDAAPGAGSSDDYQNRRIRLPPEVVETLRISIACFPETMLLSSSLSIETIRSYSRKMKHPGDSGASGTAAGSGGQSLHTPPASPKRWKWSNVLGQRRSASNVGHSGSRSGAPGLNHQPSGEPRVPLAETSGNALAPPSSLPGQPQPQWSRLRNVFPHGSDYLLDALFAHLVAYTYVSSLCPRPAGSVAGGPVTAATKSSPSTSLERRRISHAPKRTNLSVSSTATSEHRHSSDSRKSRESSNDIPKKAATLLGLPGVEEANGLSSSPNHGAATGDATAQSAHQQGQHLQQPQRLVRKKSSIMDSLRSSRLPPPTQPAATDYTSMRDLQVGLARCVARIVATLRVRGMQQAAAAAAAGGTDVGASVSAAGGDADDEMSLLADEDPKSGEIDPLLVRTLCEIVRCCEEGS